MKQDGLMAKVGLPGHADAKAEEVKFQHAAGTYVRAVSTQVYDVLPATIIENLLTNY